MGELSNDLAIFVLIICLYALCKANSDNDEPPKKKKKVWVHPWIDRRTEFGLQINLMNELCLEDKESYRLFLRMDTETFEELLAIVKPHIQTKDTTMRLAIHIADRLMITLRYLASGETRASLHFTFRLGKSTATGIIHQVCKVLVHVLKASNVMESPSTVHDWINVAMSFYYKWQFPLCLGAFDGKHVTLRPPNTLKFPFLQL